VDRHAWFLHDHRGNPITSPALFEAIATRFRQAMASFAEASHIPVIRFRKADRRVEVMRPYLDGVARTGGRGCEEDVRRSNLSPSIGHRQTGHRQASCLVKGGEETSRN